MKILAVKGKGQVLIFSRNKSAFRIIFFEIVPKENFHSQFGFIPQGLEEVELDLDQRYFAQ